jgi:hypothetical protein
MPFMGIIGDFVMARREVVVWIRNVVLSMMARWLYLLALALVCLRCALASPGLFAIVGLLPALATDRWFRPHLQSLALMAWFACS